MTTIKPIKTDCVCGHAKHVHNEGPWTDRSSFCMFEAEFFTFTDGSVTCNSHCNEYKLDNLKYMESIYDAAN